MIRFASLTLLSASVVSLQAAPDISTVKPDLVVPAMTTGNPKAGARVRQVHPDYAKTDAHHALYLPPDWKPGRTYPVIVEYAGNGPYSNKLGDISTGRVEGSNLGYGLSGGKGYIWLCLPYLNNTGDADVTQWWGDKPKHNPAPTIDYCKKTVPWICEQFGGDPERVFLTGFSRGAIACNFIGLHDDEIAKLWRGFIPYSHYDGVKTGWPYPGADRPSAIARLKRLNGRPQFICHEGGSPNAGYITETQKFIESTGVTAPFTYMPTGFRNHNDAWTLRPSPARTALREWLKKQL